MVALAPAFADPVISSQANFRAVMNAMARPGKVFEMSTELAPPTPFGRAAAAVALTLLDYESPVWVDPPLAAAPKVAQWLRFHTGAPLTTDPLQAAFAFVSDGRALPPFDMFAAGTADYPDRSTTLIVQIDAFGTGAPLRLAGPGVDGVRTFSATPLPSSFVHRLRANRSLFPCGVDLILVSDKEVAALPRSTRVIEEG